MSFNVGPSLFKTGVAGPSDPYFSFVDGLYHFDGNRNNQIGTANSHLNSTANGATPAPTSSAQFKWGTEALSLSGAVGAFAQLDAAAFNFVFGTGDFAVEFWFRSAAAGQAGNIVDLRNGATNQWHPTFYVNTTNYLAWFANGLERRATAASSIAINTWYFAALARVSSVTRFYYGTSGTAAQVGADFADANNYGPSFDSGLQVGAASNGAGRFTGAVDDVRITIGSGRGYTGATITIPTAAFEDQ